MFKKINGFLFLISIPIQVNAAIPEKSPVYIMDSVSIFKTCDHISKKASQTKHILHNNESVRKTYKDMIESACYSGLIEATVVFNDQLIMHKNDLRKACQNAQDYYEINSIRNNYRYETNLYSDCINTVSQKYNVSIIQTKDEYY